MARYHDGIRRALSLRSQPKNSTTAKYNCRVLPAIPPWQSHIIARCYHDNFEYCLCGSGPDKKGLLVKPPPSPTHRSSYRQPPIDSIFIYIYICIICVCVCHVPSIYIYITYKTLRKTHTSKCLLSANGSLRNARHFEFHNHVAHKTPASPNYFFWRYPSHYLHVVLTTNFSYLSNAQTDTQIDSRTRTHVCV